MAKITDPSKLLPSIKSSTAIVKVGKGNTINIVQKKITSSALAKRPIGDVGGKLVKIESFLKGDLVVSQKKAEQQRKEKEKQDFSEAERKLELPKISGFKLPKLPEPPSFGFLDRVKRFIFFTSLGWALPKIIEFLPKLEGFAKLIGGVYNFAEGLFGHLFNGFMSLVKFGGDLKDKTIGFIAQAKVGTGGNYKKEFDKLEKKFNDFVNISILAGVLSADIGLAAFDEYNKWKTKSSSSKLGIGLAGSRFRDSGRELGERKPGYQDPGRYRAKGQSRAGGFALEQARKKATLEASKPSKPPSWWNRIFKGPFAKLKGPLSKFAGAAVPGLGAVVGAADAKARFAAGDQLGGWMATISASLDTITAASAVLAFTGIGAVVPAAVGLVSMGIDVVLLIRDILKAFGVPVFNKGGRVVRRYQGGGSTKGGRSVGSAPRRTLRTSTTRKKPTPITIPKTQPGKDVGGEKKIREFYGKPQDPNKKYVRPPGGWLSILNIFGVNQNTQTGQTGQGKVDESAYTALVNMSKSLKGENNSLIKGVLGLVSSGVDMALGQKMDQRVLKSFLNSIGYVADTLAQQRMNTSVSSLMMQIRGFAEGGNVPSRQLRSSSAPNTGELLAKLIGPTIDQRIEEAIQGIEKELRLKGGAAPGSGEEPPSPGSDNDIPIEVDPSQVIGKVGNTGLSSAPHIHIENYATAGAPIPDGVKSSILVNGKPMTSGVMTSKVGWRTHPVLGTQKYHSGEDWDNNWNGKPISLTGGLKFVKYVAEGSDPRFSGYGNVVVIQSPDGKKYFLGHLQSGPNNLTALQQRQQQKRDQQTQQMLRTGNGISGQASWYGPGFHGNPTSVPGETFDKNKLTAAMSRPGWNPSGGRPFYVEVTNTANGKKVRVKVNDSGPFESDLITPHRTRVIDLSEAAFKRIANLNSGVINVTVEKLGSSPSTSQPPQQPSLQRLTQTSNPNIINASQMAASNLSSRIQGLKPGQKIIFNKVGSIQMGKGWFGKSQIKFYNTAGSPISKEEFEELLKSSEVLKQMRVNDRNVSNMQGGGLIGPSRPNRSIPNSFASYENYGQEMLIAIQPIQMIIEKPVPVSSGGNSMIAFPVLVGVNNNNDLDRA